MPFLKELLPEENNSGNLDIPELGQWIEEQGGLEGIIGKFHSNGLEHLLTGSSISAQKKSEHLTEYHINQIFSQKDILTLATRLGIEPLQANQALVICLPKLISMLPTSKTKVKISLDVIIQRILKNIPPLTQHIKNSLRRSIATMILLFLLVNPANTPSKSSKVISTTSAADTSTTTNTSSRYSKILHRIKAKLLFLATHHKRK